jgi:hypothetical protein
VIGIISAVRHILAVGAQLTVIGHLSSTDFRRLQIELAVAAGVVLALAIGFLLIDRASRTPDRPDEGACLSDGRPG